jgi:1-acyl-sn-glycerol-3-phosphate acyltransferase|tara:strand:- start:1644 stop:2372 length:729 start_codon:yes stop_codon:yes gene_type:complete
MLLIFRYFLLACHFVISSLVGFAIIIFRPFHHSNSRILAQIYSQIGRRIIGVNIEHHNADIMKNHEACVVVANHQSNWDLFIVGSIVPKKMVSLGKKSLKWLPFFGQVYWLGGNILVDRGNRKKAMEAMEITKTALTTKDTSIWFFAEGTRNHGKNMLPFKKGAFVTAVNAGVPILPVCTSSYLEGFDLANLDNGTAHIKVLEPIETKGLTLDDVDQLMLDIHLAMMDGIQEMDQKSRQSRA